MIKLGNKGFFLAETVIVTGVVATVLILFYSQISQLYRNFERNADYNTVETIHAAYNLKTYIEQNHTASLISDLQASSTPLFDITYYEFDTTGYYDSLISSLNVKKVYFTPYNINNVIDNYATYNVNVTFLDYLRMLRADGDRPNVYRVIVILKNNNYSSALVSIP